MWIAGGFLGLLSIAPSLDVASGGAAVSAAGVAVSIPRAPDGQYYADVSIGGRSIRALIDPDSDRVLIAGADAPLLGLASDTRPVTLQPIAIGGLTLTGVPAQVAPDLPVSIIGRPALARLSQVEAADGALLLR